MWLVDGEGVVYNGKVMDSGETDKGYGKYMRFRRNI